MGRAKNQDKRKESESEVEESGEEEGYSVESILDRRELSKGKVEYLLKWQGYSQ